MGKTAKDVRRWSEGGMKEAKRQNARERGGISDLLATLDLRLVSN